MRSSRLPSSWFWLALLLGACEREDRPFSAITPVRFDTPVDTEGRAQASGAHHTTHNAYSISEGQRLFEWFNCSGCHGGQGGGHIGPALRDAEWRYGGSIEEIRSSIVDGRPNGMPAYRGLIDGDQLWQLSAFVLSLSGRVPQHVAAGRPDGISRGEPPVMHVQVSPRPERTKL
jgi:cytochrome c oxidase cbb3-type subunit III